MHVYIDIYVCMYIYITANKGNNFKLSHDGSCSTETRQWRVQQQLLTEKKADWWSQSRNYWSWGTSIPKFSHWKNYRLVKKTFHPMIDQKHKKSCIFPIQIAVDWGDTSDLMSHSDWGLGEQQLNGGVHVAWLPGTFCTKKTDGVNWVNHEKWRS